MNRILPLILCGLCGCATQVNVQQLAKQLSENNASFTLTIEPKKLTIQRVNPPIGFLGVVSTNGLQHSPPPGMQLGVNHLIHSAGAPPPDYVKTKTIAPQATLITNAPPSAPATNAPPATPQPKPETKEQP